MSKRRLTADFADSGLMGADVCSSSFATDSANFVLSTPPDCKIRRQHVSSFDSGLGTSLVSPPNNIGVFAGPSSSPALSTPKNILNRSGGGGMSAYIDAVPMSPMRYLGGLSPVSAMFEHTNSDVAGPSSATVRRTTLALNDPNCAIEYRFCGAQVSDMGSNGLVEMGSPQAAALRLQHTRLTGESSNQPMATGRNSNRCLLLGDTELAMPPSAFAESTPLSTSTPVRTSANTNIQTNIPSVFMDNYAADASVNSMCNYGVSSSTVGSTYECNQQQPASVVMPSVVSPLRSQNGANCSFPRTPTPFKKALAAIERSHGKLNNQEQQGDDSQQQQIVHDLRDIISSDFQSHSTPSTIGNSLATNTALELRPCMSRQVSNKTTESVQYFKSPSKTPKPFSKRWMRLTCGRTKRQLEMTRLARAFLQLPPPMPLFPSTTAGYSTTG